MVRDKLVLSDFQLFSEGSDEAKRRIFESTGIIGVDSFESCEELGPRNIKERLIQIPNPKSYAKYEEEKKGDPKKEKPKTKEQLIKEKREAIELRNFQIKMTMFCVSFTGMIMSYTYIYLYLI